MKRVSVFSLISICFMAFNAYAQSQMNVTGISPQALEVEFIGVGSSKSDAYKIATEIEAAIGAAEHVASYLGVNLNYLKGSKSRQIKSGPGGKSFTVADLQQTLVQFIKNINVHSPICMKYTEAKKADLITLESDNEGNTFYEAAIPCKLVLDKTAYKSFFTTAQTFKAAFTEDYQEEIGTELDEVEKAASGEAPAKKPKGQITGIIIDASKLRFKMNGFPCIYGKGKKHGWEIYSPEVLNAGVADEMGYVEYAYSEIEARQHTDRIGTNPVVIEAKKAFSKGNQDLLVKKADAALMVTLDNKHELLKQGKVVIVLKAK